MSDSAAIPSTTSLPDFGEPAFGLTKTLPGVSYQDAMDKTVAELQKVGFGVLTQIDMAATMAAKLHTDFTRPYMILGACNPQLAYRALSAIPAIGLLLPCNVVVTTDGEGNAVVSMIKPEAMFSSMIQEPGMESMVDEVTGLLTQVLDAL